MFDAHKNYIFTWFADALANGAFDEQVNESDAETVATHGPVKEIIVHETDDRERSEVLETPAAVQRPINRPQESRNTIPLRLERDTTRWQVKLLDVFRGKRSFLPPNRHNSIANGRKSQIINERLTQDPRVLVVE